MTDISAPRLLSRAAAGAAPAPPVRIVHLGLGAFHRAHQAWYTARAADAAEWGIAAFTGRSADLVDRLEPQDGLYTLIERGADGDGFEIIPNIARVGAGNDAAAFIDALSAPEVAILTLTITEAAYPLGRDGHLDLDAPGVRADLALLRSGAGEPVTALGRILRALDERRRVGAPPIAVVPCDNIPDNGALAGRLLAELAELTLPELAAWLPRGIRVVSTSVDRITPRTTDADTALVADRTGWLDAAPVVTEPFSDWVLSGEFPAGRPAWETAGARFVDEIRPWELRKLWMLNGAHTLLALLGRTRGHRVVAEAITDPVIRDAVERLWDEDARHLPALGLAAYRSALLERFGNPRIEHGLDQIAQDSTTKLRVRVVPVALRERAAGRPATGAATAVAAWLMSIARGGTPRPAAVEGTRALIAALDEQLAVDDGFRLAVERARTALAASPPATSPPAASAPAASAPDASAPEEENGPTA